MLKDCLLISHIPYWFIEKNIIGFAMQHIMNLTKDVLLLSILTILIGTFILIVCVFIDTCLASLYLKI